MAQFMAESANGKKGAQQSFTNDGSSELTPRSLAIH